MPGCEQLCFAVRRNSSTALGVAEGVSANRGKAAAESRKGWRCLGLELHSVPGQGLIQKGFGYAVVSENHSLPSW